MRRGRKKADSKPKPVAESIGAVEKVDVVDTVDTVAVEEPKAPPVVQDSGHEKVTIMGTVVVGNRVNVKGDTVDIEVLEKYGIDVNQLKARGLAK